LYIAQPPIGAFHLMERGDVTGLLERQLNFCIRPNLAGVTPNGPDLLSGLIVYPISEAKAVLKQYRAFVTDSPEELAVWAVLRLAPPLPHSIPSPASACNN